MPKKARRPTAKYRPLWTLERGITNSGLSRWSQCPEQFALSYMDGWTSRKISVPITYGNLWHCAQESQGSKRPWHLVDKYLKEARQNLIASAARELDLLALQVRAVFPVYADYYKDADKRIKWIEREKLFTAPKEILGEMVPLRGKRDGAYRFGKNELGLFETKTKSKIDQRAISNLLRCDFQTLLYLWALREEHGVCPTELTYNVVKRPTLRQGAKESVTDFCKRIALDARRQPHNYFLRWAVTIRSADLDRFDQHILTPTLNAFVSWWRGTQKNPSPAGRNAGSNPLHYTNLNALVTPYGHADLYDLLVVGDKTGYYRRSSPHPELES